MTGKNVFAGNSFNTEDGPFNIISDSMSDAVVLPSLVCRLSRTTQARARNTYETYL
jgi:hypothetical protein